MKNTIFTLAVLLGLSISAQAQQAGKATTDNVHLTKNGNFIAVTLDLGFSELDIRHGRAVLLTPVISKGDSTATLHSVGLYSHNRWFYYQRNGEHMISGKDEISFKAADAPEFIVYEEVIPYKEWMDGAELRLYFKEYGCCNKCLDDKSSFLARYDGPYYPEFLYITPAAEAGKVRHLSGKAYVDFPVNETKIYPEYHNNEVELGKIKSTIDSIRIDSDITLKSLSIKGYASPESPYANNARLAEGRTNAIKEYVTNMYSLNAELILTEYEPEDWEGLREYVESSTLNNKEDILAIIDSDREPDNKEWKIKSEYPAEYQFLLKNCYPFLRHTDYRIEYIIKSYTSPEEIAAVIWTKPQNLSLNEFYLYAQTLEPGSPEYIEVYETAVRMFPDDATANLNAANTAMGRGDMRNALRYLDKAGDSPEATYARALYEYYDGKLEAALELLKTALGEGITKAEEPIIRITEIINNNNN